MPNSVSRYSSIILFVVVPLKLTTYKDDSGERTIFFCSGSWPLYKPMRCTYISLIHLCHVQTFSGALTRCHAALLQKGSAVLDTESSVRRDELMNWCVVPGLFLSWISYGICWTGTENCHPSFSASQFDDRRICPQYLLGCCLGIFRPLSQQRKVKTRLLYVSRKERCLNFPSGPRFVFYEIFWPPS